jgi:hypothetical protein
MTFLQEARSIVASCAVSCPEELMLKKELKDIFPESEELIDCLLESTEYSITPNLVRDLMELNSRTPDQCIIVMISANDFTGMAAEVVKRNKFPRINTQILIPKTFMKKSAFVVMESHEFSMAQKDDYCEVPSGIQYQKFRCFKINEQLRYNCICNIPFGYHDWTISFDLGNLI